uniref:ELMO domain-containing protein n=1 Tax=Elaeophora elaphi TaxID=1147741 RepID=A0A0R3RTE8_9BILA
MDWHDESPFFNLYQNVCFIFRRLLRLTLNWLMLMVTGKTELERILTWKVDNRGQITTKVEKLIDEGELSTMPRFWKAGQEDQLATEIVRKCCSEVDIEQFDEMRDVLKRSLSQIRGYRELCDHVEEMCKEKYDLKNEIHEKSMLYMKGHDPATDFRGMGMLSLEQLIFLAQYDVAHAQSILSLSNHPLYGFPMALTGINLTALIRRLLQKNALKMHFYNTTCGTPTIDNFHHVFCTSFEVRQVFKLFCAFWKRRKPDLIYFNKIKDDFEAQLMVHLYSQEANLDKLDVRSFE